MSAAGRLWRRAPVWRLSLLSAIALSGLAAMFPPTLPPLHWPDGQKRATGADGATFHPRPHADASSPDDSGVIEMPPPGPARTGLIPFAGRLLPLPDGGWQTAALVSSPGGEQQVFLVRIVQHRLTGLMLAAGTGVFGGPAGPIGVPPQCAAPDRLAGAIVPVQPGQSPLQHECWSIVSSDMKKIVAEDSASAVSQVLTRMGALGVSVPDRMLSVQFVRSTDRGWQDTVVMVPDAGGTTTALAAWAGRYLALLHKGFDRTATTADMTPAALRIP